MPIALPSRPSPLSLTPPNGAEAVLIIPVFIPTIPVSICFATRKTRERSLEQKYDARPTEQSLATSKASSSVSKDWIAATGPNVSSFQMRDSVSTSVIIVGWKKFAPTSGSAEPPVTHFPPSVIASSTLALTLSAAFEAMRGPIVAPSFMPGATFNCSTAATNFDTNSSCVLRWTKNRSAQTHVWPA